MRQICVLFIFSLVFGISAAAAEREKIYADQLDCATLKVLKIQATDAEVFQMVLADAVDECVTVQDMAATCKGCKRYEERNPETVCMEREERQGYLVKGVLHRIETCRQNGRVNGVATQACSDFLGAKKGG